MLPVGIDQISFYTSNYFLDLRTLAESQDIDPEKYYTGIGQEKMGMPAHDEDIVTMAANAAAPFFDTEESKNVSTLLFATETGIDQSKAAGVYVHRLLGLNENCRVVELKQACYSATAAVQMACALVARQPNTKILVIASDIAKYELDTPGEATQGCGAVAMLITSNPRILNINPEVGNYTEDVMDFWRPNYRKTALVDGKFSTKIYLKSLKKAWENFSQVSDLSFSDLKHVCYHLPFSRMAQKAHKHLSKINNADTDLTAIESQLEDSLIYNKLIGNSYAAALFIGFTSLIENSEKLLSGERIGFFSYGSGCVAEFFSGTIVDGYEKYLFRNQHKVMLEKRTELTHSEYLDLYHAPDPVCGEDHHIAAGTKGKYRLSGFSQHKRNYVAI